MRTWPPVPPRAASLHMRRSNQQSKCQLSALKRTRGCAAVSYLMKMLHLSSATCEHGSVHSNMRL